MSEHEQAVARYYGRFNLGESILAALRRMGKDVAALQPDDLAAVDAFHLRGRAGTEELARFCEPGPEHHVLDVGCGLGGTARFLAARSGCRATGLDLTPEYVAAARMLTGHLGLADRVDFHAGSALAMPFADASFDMAWSEHVQMNVPDKPGFYGEIHRVLKSGARFAFHDILQGAGGAPHYPCPWAAEAAHSTLIGAADLRRLLGSLGFDVKLWEDKTAAAREWLGPRLAAQAEKGAPPLGLHLLMGAATPQALGNTLRNLAEHRIAVVQGVVQKVH